MKKFSIALAALATMVFVGSATAQDMDRGGMGMRRDGMHHGMMHRGMHRDGMMMHRHHRRHMMRRMMRDM